MARDREALGPTQWVIDSDETALLAYVSVTQTMGSHAYVNLQTHHLRDDSKERVLASYKGDTKANSFPELLRALRHALDVAEKHYYLTEERESRSN